MCDHSETALLDVKANKATRSSFCEKDEYCFFEHLLPLDLKTVSCAFNIFFLIEKSNEMLPNE